MTGAESSDKKAEPAATACVEMAYRIEELRRDIERGKLAWSGTLDDAVKQVVAEALRLEGACYRARQRPEAQLRIARGEGD